MSEYTPDRWSIVEMKSPKETVYKILASWYGGYAGSDSWQLSSGIVSVTETDDAYDFLNYSGSIYRCYKKIYGMSGYTASVYLGFEKLNGDEGSIRSLKEDEIIEHIAKWRKT